MRLSHRPAIAISLALLTGCDGGVPRGGTSAAGDAETRDAAWTTTPIDAGPSAGDAAQFSPDAALPLVPDGAPPFPDAVPTAAPDAAPPLSDDGATSRGDASAPIDAAPVMPDAAAPLPDSVPPLSDAVPKAPDALMSDAAPPLPDAAPPDAAPPLPDAALSLPDAASVFPDALPMVTDATPPLSDALTPDAVLSIQDATLPDAALPCLEGETRPCGVCPDALERCVAGTFGACANPGPACRGAAVPWDEYEAEAADSNGTRIPPSVVVGTVAAEMSGRSGVRLAAVGDYIEFAAARPANTLVVRYSIPDTQPSTLNVYVDGVYRTSLAVTPRYAWHYGLPAWLNGGPSLPSQDPAVGNPFHFFDEAHVTLGDVSAGARIRLQKDAENNAAEYIVDLADLEWAPPPLSMPQGFLSLTADCGATADDDVDDGQALDDCLTRGRTEGRGVWIPPGRFRVADSAARPRGFRVDRNTVQGAGLWHSTLEGAGAGFFCVGQACRFADFALFGDTTVRDDARPDNGFQGSFATGSAITRVWIEHKKAGIWAGLDVQPNGNTDGLQISECRIRDVFADGANLSNGTQNSSVTETHLRGTGDDGLAQWSYVQPGGVNRANRFTHDTVQLPWRATCLAVYGGEDSTVEDNLCSDTLTFPGLQIGGPYPQLPFSGTMAVRRNTLVRAGGVSFNQKFGALKLYSYQVDQIGVVVEDVEIDDPPYYGLEFSSWGADASQIVGATFDRVTIRRPGEFGLQIRGSARGSATVSNVSVESPGVAGLHTPGGANPTFRLDRGPGDVGF